MNQYKIEKLIRSTTSTGKAKISASLIDVNNVLEENVTIWGDFPNFDNLAVGDIIMGNVMSKNALGKDNRMYTNKTLYPAKNTGNRSFAPKNDISVAMEKKADMIDEAQEKKAKNIEEAQGRNERMWAKYGACEIIAHHPAYKDLNIEDVQVEIGKLGQYILTGKLEQPPF